MITFEVPNLDDASVDWQDYDRLSEVLRMLADYARNKGDAMFTRAAGGITRAQKLEARNERIYNDLPGWARW